MIHRHILTFTASISGIITLILIPITINIATSELPQWVKDNRNWAWLVIIFFGLLTVILARLSTSLSTESSFQSSANELNEITTKVNNAIYIANHDPVLIK